MKGRGEEDNDGVGRQDTCAYNWDADLKGWASARVIGAMFSVGVWLFPRGYIFKTYGCGRGSSFLTNKNGSRSLQSSPQGNTGHHPRVHTWVPVSLDVSWFRHMHCWYSQLTQPSLESALPRWLSNKESACQCRTCRFYPWVRKIPSRRKWQPTPLFLPGKSHGQRSLVGYSPWGRRVRHDWGAEHTHIHNQDNTVFLRFQEGMKSAAHPC